MTESIIKLLKKTTTPVICIALLVATMGMTVLAATNGTLTGSLTNSTGKAELKNKSGNTRYCHVMVREYDSTSSYSTVASNSGNISSGNKISASGKISKNHAQGVGVIYNSSTPQSGAALTKYTSIK